MTPDLRSTAGQSNKIEQMCYRCLMTGAAVADDQQGLLIDSLKAADRELAKAQARRAQLMVEFADARKRADRHRIHGIESGGGQARYKPGEFVAMEIGLAVTATRHAVQRDVARARRLQAEAPDAWEAWTAGDLNEAKAAHISHALLRLVREDSKKMLNLLVVPAAITRTPELLRRWLNRFIARVEPDQADDRIRRSLEDRYVSVRPDLDGVSFLSACLPALDAASVDLVLDALVGIADTGDPRTKAQRRADALVDLLLGRISNGWRPAGADGDWSDPDGESADAEAGPAAEPGPSWSDDDDWDLPASAFRPDPRSAEQSVVLTEESLRSGAAPGGRPRRARTRPPLPRTPTAPGDDRGGAVYPVPARRHRHPRGIGRRFSARPGHGDPRTGRVARHPVLPAAHRSGRESARRQRAGPLSLAEAGRCSAISRRSVHQPGLPRSSPPGRPGPRHSLPERPDRRGQSRCEVP